MRQLSLRHLTLLGLAALAVGACSRDDSTDPGPRHQSAENPFPVRLLPPRPTLDPDLVLEEDFRAGPGEWYVLGMQERRMSLERVADSDMASIDGDDLVLPQGQATLVRFLELPPGQQHDVSVTLLADEGARVGELSSLLHFCVIQELAEGTSADDVVARREIEAPGRTIPFLVALPHKFKFQRERPQARWRSARDLHGYARAEHRIIDTDTRRLYAIFVPAVDQEVRLRSFKIRRMAQFRTQTSVSRSKEGAALVKLSGDVRPAVWLDRDDTLEVPVTLPAGASRITLALGEDPDAEAGTSCDVAVTVVGSDGAVIEASTQELERTTAGPTWHPVELPLGRYAADAARPATLRVRLAGALGAFLAQPLVRGRAQDERKNVLLVSLDTLRADHLGSYGYPRPTSPFLDEHAGGAARFTNYFSVAPYTLPTHATMLTGRLPQRHGAVTEIDRLDARKVPYLPLILAEHGYATAAFTGGGFLSEVFGFPDGFDRFSTDDPIKPRDDRRDQAGADILDLSPNMRDVISWVDDHRDERWFLFLHSFMVHDYKPPVDDFARFDTAPAVTPGLDHFVYLRDREWEETPPLPGDIQHYVDLYDATLHYADRVLRMLFDHLDELGLLDDTIVVITADHGEEFWEHGSFKHSVTLYDEMLRVPLWIDVPGLEPQKVLAPTSQADLTPTLLDLLGVEHDPSQFDGHSRADHLRGTPRPDELNTPLYAAVDTKLANRASIRTGRMKVIQNHRSTNVNIRAKDAVELYDTGADRGEQHNLAETRATDLADALLHLRVVEDFLTGARVLSGHAEMDPALMEQMRQLGYVGAGGPGGLGAAAGPPGGGDAAAGDDPWIADGEVIRVDEVSDTIEVRIGGRAYDARRRDIDLLGTDGRPTSAERFAVGAKVSAEIEKGRLTGVRLR